MILTGWNRHIFLVLALVPLVVFCQFNCNPLLPHCRQNLLNGGGTNSFGSSKPNKPCNYKDLWLIPTRSDDSCTRTGVPKIVEIDSDSVRINPPIIRIPGCFTIEMQMRVLSRAQQFPSSFFGKVEFQWWNFHDFSNLQCQNTSSNGCNGFGNNCYYCDICNSLTHLDTRGMSHAQSSLVEQFRGLNCPDRPGIYTFRRRFCFNDWKAFDKDGDCKFDFLKNDSLQQYKSALLSLQQIGFGTMFAKFKLSHNATAEQLHKKITKEAEIAERVKGELADRKNDWDVQRFGSFQSFLDNYIKYRQDLWHKEKYLQWLIYTNEVACLKVTFDVCDKEPTEVTVPWNLEPFYSGPQMQCI